MALALNTSYWGVQSVPAYISIMHGHLSVNQTELTFKVTYKVGSKEGPTLKSSGYAAPYTLSGDNPFVQAYNYLKTLPEFDGSTDC